MARAQVPRMHLKTIGLFVAQGSMGNKGRVASGWGIRRSWKRVSHSSQGSAAFWSLAYRIHPDHGEISAPYPSFLCQDSNGASGTVASSCPWVLLAV